MRVLGLVGSPRKKSNTDLVVSSILGGAAASNHNVDKLYLYGLTLNPCVDCRACKHGVFQCMLKDDMQQIYHKLENSDVIIFGTPLYWYGPSAQMKLFLDRLRPYITSKKLKGKKAILVIPSEEGATACKHIIGMFSLSLKYLEMILLCDILPLAFERSEITNQPQILNEAYEIGRKLR
jgi:multimeric flavodoxin WrbA